MSEISWKFFKERTGHRWEAYNEDGELVGRSSQTFSSANGAQYNAHLLGYEGEFSQNVRWEFDEASKGWKWQAFSTVNEEEIAASNRYFDTRSEAEENAALFGYKRRGGLSPQAVAAGYEDRPLTWLWWLIGGLLLLGLLFLWPRLTNWMSNSSSVASNITDVISQNKNLDSFENLARLSGVSLTPPEGKTYTVFAPTNNALNLPNDTLSRLQAGVNRQVLVDLIQCQIVEGDYSRDQLTNGLVMKTLHGKDITVSRDGDTIRINDVTIEGEAQSVSGGRVFTTLGLIDLDKAIANLAPVTTATQSESSSSVESSSSSSSSSVSSIPGQQPQSPVITTTGANFAAPQFPNIRANVGSWQLLANPIGSDGNYFFRDTLPRIRAYQWKVSDSNQFIVSFRSTPAQSGFTEVKKTDIVELTNGWWRVRYPSTDHWFYVRSEQVFGMPATQKINTQYISDVPGVLTKDDKGVQQTALIYAYDDENIRNVDSVVVNMGL